MKKLIMICLSIVTAINFPAAILASGAEKNEIIMDYNLQQMVQTAEYNGCQSCDKSYDFNVNQQLKRNEESQARSMEKYYPKSSGGSMPDLFKNMNGADLLIISAVSGIAVVFIMSFFGDPEFTKVR